MKNLIIARLTLVTALSWGMISCAMPGRPALVANSIQETEEVSGSFRAVASCIVHTLDDEPTRLNEYTLPVNRAVDGPDGNSVELQGGNHASPTVLLYEAIVRETSPGYSSIAIIARKDDGPFLGTTYIFDKIKRVSLGCSLPNAPG